MNAKKLIQKILDMPGVRIKLIQKKYQWIVINLNGSVMVFTDRPWISTQVDTIWVTGCYQTVDTLADVTNHHLAPVKVEDWKDSLTKINGSLDTKDYLVYDASKSKYQSKRGPTKFRWLATKYSQSERDVEVEKIRVTSGVPISIYEGKPL